jgi:hypothetical protein
MKKIVTIVTSSVLLALLPSITQAQTGKEAAPQAGSADTSGGLAAAAAGKPAKTVGGATRGVKKNADGKEQPAVAKEKEKEKEKAVEAKPAPAAATSK